jgi:hypothetical protein
MKTADLAHPTRPSFSDREIMQTIYILPAPSLLMKRTSTAGVVSSETLTTRLSPKMSRLSTPSPMRRIGTRRLWQRQSRISRKWIDTTVGITADSSGDSLLGR